MQQQFSTQFTWKNFLAYHWKACDIVISDFEQDGAAQYSFALKERIQGKFLLVLYSNQNNAIVFTSRILHMSLSLSELALDYCDVEILAWHALQDLVPYEFDLH